MFLRTTRDITWSLPLEADELPAALAEGGAPPEETFADIVARRGLPEIENVTPEKELRQLLEAAAEVEHGLLTQYLGAVYSSTNPTIGKIIRKIAVEEMGHLVTVQNLLIALGASPYLGRYDKSPGGHFVPFQYGLEPVSRLTIATYAACERPEDGQIDPEDKDVLPDILKDAATVNPQRIGLLYAKIYWLLRESDDPLADPSKEPWIDYPVAAVAKIAPGRHVAAYPVDDSLTGQARPDDWAENNKRVIVETIATREAARRAVARISAQGEGFAGEGEGHFDTFVTAYREALSGEAIGQPAIGQPFATSPWYAGSGFQGKPEAEITLQNSVDVAKLGDRVYEATLLVIGIALDPKNGLDSVHRSELAAFAIRLMREAIAQLAFDMPRLTTRPNETTPLSLCLTLPPPLTESPRTRFDAVIRDAIDLASDLAAREDLHSLVRGDAETIRDVLQQAPAAPEPGGSVMAKRYRIHPGIGIARVGPSTDGYFIDGETRGARPFELDASGAETAFRGYKDTSFLIRPQGVRFRVLEYERDSATGAETFLREITAADATIEWTVTLGNSKAAGPFMDSDTGLQGEQVIVPGSGRRNDTVTNRADLRTQAEKKIGATAQTPATITGTIMTKTVPLGAIGTDAAGRAIVVGGDGLAASWMNPPKAIDDYLNNDGWYDGISDGPVDAEVVFPDGTRVNPYGAWVIVAPPDFAPEIRPLVSFHDVMADALGIAPSRVSFQHDVLPILQRTADLRWVNPKAVWGNVDTALHNINALADPGTGSASVRSDAAALVRRSELDANLRGFRLTRTQKTKILDPWVAGTFDSDLGSAPRPMPLGAELDFVALSACIGSGFFPGIEIGFMSTNKELYSEPGRFTRNAFNDFGVSSTLEPGSITQRMAVPWQADFMECSNGIWWPPQRPDIFRFRPDGTSPGSNNRWDRGLVVGNTASPQSHRNMVDHFAKLGVIERVTLPNGQTVFAEVGRKSPLP